MDIKIHSPTHPKEKSIPEEFYECKPIEKAYKYPNVTEHAPPFLDTGFSSFCQKLTKELMELNHIDFGIINNEMELIYPLMSTNISHSIAIVPKSLSKHNRLKIQRSADLLYSVIIPCIKLSDIEHVTLYVQINKCYIPLSKISYPTSKEIKFTDHPIPLVSIHYSSLSIEVKFHKDYNIAGIPNYPVQLKIGMLNPQYRNKINDNKFDSFALKLITINKLPYSFMETLVIYKNDFAMYYKGGDNKLICDIKSQYLDITDVRKRPYRILTIVVTNNSKDFIDPLSNENFNDIQGVAITPSVIKDENEFKKFKDITGIDYNPSTMGTVYYCRFTIEDKFYHDCLSTGIISEENKVNV